MQVKLSNLRYCRNLAVQHGGVRGRGAPGLSEGSFWGDENTTILSFRWSYTNEHMIIILHSCQNIHQNPPHLTFLVKDLTASFTTVRVPPTSWTTPPTISILHSFFWRFYLSWAVLSRQRRLTSTPQLTELCLCLTELALISCNWNQIK